MAKSYALYDTEQPNPALVEIFTDLATGSKAMDNLNASELRTYKYITPSQIKSLSYAEAVVMEYNLRYARLEALGMLEQVIINQPPRYGK
jgi:hypothetical protein